MAQVEVLSQQKEAISGLNEMIRSATEAAERDNVMDRDVVERLILVLQTLNKQPQ